MAWKNRAYSASSVVFASAKFVGTLCALPAKPSPKYMPTNVPTTGNWAGSSAASHASANTLDRRPARWRRVVYTSSVNSPSAARPAAVASGLPASVPAWNTAPNGDKVSIRSCRPPTAPMGRPPPITLPKVVRSGRTPYTPCAPPAPRRNPVITSSNTNSAPTRSHSARRPSRNPGFGATTPMLAATGSTNTAATRSSSSGTSLYGTTSVLATALAGTPAVPGRPRVATPLPPAANSASVAPWKLPWKMTMRSRPVKPRARRTAVLVASVPLFISRTRSQLDTRSRMASANFISRGVGAPYEVPPAAAVLMAAVTTGWAWPSTIAP